MIHFSQTIDLVVDQSEIMITNEKAVQNVHLDCSELPNEPGGMSNNGIMSGERGAGWWTPFENTFREADWSSLSYLCLSCSSGNRQDVCHPSFARWPESIRMNK